MASYISQSQESNVSFERHCFSSQVSKDLFSCFVFADGDCPGLKPCNVRFQGKAPVSVSLHSPGRQLPVSGSLQTHKALYSTFRNGEYHSSIRDVDSR